MSAAVVEQAVQLLAAALAVADIEAVPFALAVVRAPGAGAAAVVVSSARAVGRVALQPVVAVDAAFESAAAPQRAAAGR